ncbi:MAG: serine/threonine protein kinase [Flavobacterium sp.]|nr:MAG: serine/threonine protein kinase [Flavobacterium sp.]
MSFIKFLFSKAFLRQLLIAIGILVVLVFGLLFWLKSSTNHNQKIRVPSLAKMSLDEAQIKLDELDLRFEILDSSNYNPDFPKYSIIEQIPKSGEYVKENRKIYLTLNRSGYVFLEIPEVVGKTRRQAEPTLLSMGFKIGKVSYKPYIALDEVLELRYKGKKIKPGDELQKTSVIDLVLGDGKGSLKSNLEVSDKKIKENNGGE